MSEMEVKNRFWVMKTLPDGNDFESSLEIREENKIEIPEGCFATKKLIFINGCRNEDVYD